MVECSLDGCRILQLLGFVGSSAISCAAQLSSSRVPDNVHGVLPEEFVLVSPKGGRPAGDLSVEGPAFVLLRQTWESFVAGRKHAEHTRRGEDLHSSVCTTTAETFATATTCRLRLHRKPEQRPSTYFSSCSMFRQVTLVVMAATALADRPALIAAKLPSSGSASDFRAADEAEKSSSAHIRGPPIVPTRDYVPLALHNYRPPNHQPDAAFASPSKISQLSLDNARTQIPGGYDASRNSFGSGQTQVSGGYDASRNSLDSARTQQTGPYGTSQNTAERTQKQTGGYDASRNSFGSGQTHVSGGYDASRNSLDSARTQQTGPYGISRQSPAQQSSAYEPSRNVFGNGQTHVSGGYDASRSPFGNGQLQLPGGYGASQQSLISQQAGGEGAAGVSGNAQNLDGRIERGTFDAMGRMSDFGGGWGGATASSPFVPRAQQPTGGLKDWLPAAATTQMDDFLGRRPGSSSWGW